jgi:hypothetical protein
MEKNLRDFDTLFDNTRKLTEQLNDQLRRNDVLGEKNRSLEEDLKGSHSELSVSRGEVQRLTRLLENEQRRAARYQDRLTEEKGIEVRALDDAAATCAR